MTVATKMSTNMLIFADLNVNMVTFGSVKNMAATCKRASTYTALTKVLKSEILRRLAFTIFTQFWFLRTAIRFAVCPPQAVLLNDLRPLLPTWSVVHKTVHHLYQEQLQSDPHQGHIMRAIQHTNGLFSFPIWMMAWPITNANSGQLPETSTYSIIRGHRTWWSSWPSDPLMTWPLTLSPQDITNMLRDDTNMRVSQSTLRATVCS
jgi:hypothetical protein